MTARMQGSAGSAQRTDGRSVHVRVPATSANLGPGFDALGLALTLYDEVTVRVGGDELVVLVDGEGAQDVPRDATHLLVHAMQVGLTGLGAAELLSGVEVSCTNRVPHARGLGSSAGAIVGGLVAARALAPTDAYTDDELLDIAAGLEGHPDNVAACLLGGLTLAWSMPPSGSAPAAGSGPTVQAIRKEPAPDLVATVFVPAAASSTEEARALLPATVPHRDAAQNAARAALLVEALTGRPEHLFAATEDSLHQRYREKAMPESVQLVDSLRSGGQAAVLSGAGPSVLVLSLAADGEAAAELAELAAACPDGWRTHRLAVDRAGATVSYAQR